jgi:hypothetical protein
MVTLTKKDARYLSANLKWMRDSSVPSPLCIRANDLESKEAQKSFTLQLNGERSFPTVSPLRALGPLSKDLLSDGLFHDIGWSYLSRSGCGTTMILIMNIATSNTTAMAVPFFLIESTLCV